MTDAGAVLTATLVWAAIALLLILGVAAALARPTKIEPVKTEDEDSEHR